MTCTVEHVSVNNQTESSVEIQPGLRNNWSQGHKCSQDPTSLFPYHLLCFSWQVSWVFVSFIRDKLLPRGSCKFLPSDRVWFLFSGSSDSSALGQTLRTRSVNSEQEINTRQKHGSSQRNHTTEKGRVVLKNACTVLSCFSPVQLFETPWTVAHQAPLSMGFPKQEYWSGLRFPFPECLLDLWIKPMSPALAGRFFTTETQIGKCYFQ